MACATGRTGRAGRKMRRLPAFLHSIQYIVQQMADFKSGARKTSVPQRIPPQLMIKTAKGITDTEVEQAAAYFSGLKLRAAIKVVETATVPKTRVAGWFLAALPGGEAEPIAGRIIEVPEDLERFEMRDSRSHFIAYVPPGSIEQGQLGTTGGSGKSAPCTICHGPDLNGLGPIPGLAGRSPSYLVRQLYDFQHGTRAGPWSPLMAPNVIKLMLDDMVVLAAYAASPPP